jgi:hypothetical protein
MIGRLWSGEPLTYLRRRSADSGRLCDKVDGLKGPSRCRNPGLEQSLGEYVMILDSDDLLASWCIGARQQRVKRGVDISCDAIQKSALGI